MVGVDAGKANGGAVGVMYEDVHVKVVELFLEISHHRHLRELRFILGSTLSALVEQELPALVKASLILRLNRRQRVQQATDVAVRTFHDVRERHQRIVRFEGVWRDKA